MILGIDLGTTNSLAAVWQEGAARMVPNALGSFLTPSCVSLADDGSVLVGQAARDRLQTYPERTAAVFKRHMGSDKQYRLGERLFRAEELSSLVLRALKEDAEVMLGEPIEEAIITVPAYFSDTQRQATRAAGLLAGLRVERLINEPTAAALAYGLHQDCPETQFLVFDLGGGTFDVSVLELFEGVMEVRATAGDNFLGGEDFTLEIVRHFLDATMVPEALRKRPEFMQRVHAQAEWAKQKLSRYAAADMQVLWQEDVYACGIDENTLALLCEPLLVRLRTPIERSLRDANLQIGDISQVVLAGGATRMPVVRQLVTRLLQRFPTLELDVDQVVAMGAAVAAGLKAKDTLLDEYVMTDVSPYTLGIEVARTLPDQQLLHGYFSPIIERNTVVPASREETYYPTEDGQRNLLVGVYQGESRLIRDNIHLGNLNVPLPGKAQHESPVLVRFTYDVNGMLEVEVTPPGKGKAQRLLIQGNASRLSEDEIAARLKALAGLKIHPRDQAENQAVLARAERVYASLKGDSRTWIGNEIHAFEREMLRQDPARIRRARAQLADCVEHFEDSAPFAGQD